MDRPGNTRGGFTLIELLLVVAIVILLTVIVVPRIMGAGQRAKEALLSEQLQELRRAIEQFAADCGAVPADLSQLQVRPVDGDLGGGGMPLDATGWCGPYPATSDGDLPKDPFTGATDSWGYEPGTGGVWSGSDLISLEGDPYANW